MLENASLECSYSKWFPNLAGALPDADFSTAAELLTQVLAAGRSAIQPYAPPRDSALVTWPGVNIDPPDSAAQILEHRRWVAAWPCRR